jgi:hypothetical protein
MMLTRLISVAALAAVAGIFVTTNAAEAGSRWRLHYLNPYYYIYDPEPLYLYSSDYGDEEYNDDDDEQPMAYYDPDDDEYYEPRYRGDEYMGAPPKKKKVVSKAVPAPKPVIKKSVASSENKAVITTEKKSVVSSDEKEVASIEKKTVPTAGGMSCDKAGKIVSGYGFTSVKPTTCTGQVFAFNATRSGKAYTIKLSAASGELTEVKKVQ